MSFVDANFPCFLHHSMTAMSSLRKKRCFGIGTRNTWSISPQVAREYTALLTANALRLITSVSKSKISKVAAMFFYEESMDAQYWVALVKQGGGIPGQEGVKQSEEDEQDTT